MGCGASKDQVQQPAQVPLKGVPECLRRDSVMCVDVAPAQGLLLCARPPLCGQAPRTNAMYNYIASASAVNWGKEIWSQYSVCRQRAVTSRRNFAPFTSSVTGHYNSERTSPSAIVHDACALCTHAEAALGKAMEVGWGPSADKEGDNDCRDWLALRRAAEDSDNARRKQGVPCGEVFRCIVLLLSRVVSCPARPSACPCPHILRTPLRQGWLRFWDADQQSHYYHHPATGKTSWLLET